MEVEQPNLTAGAASPVAASASTSGVSACSGDETTEPTVSMSASKDAPPAFFCAISCDLMDDPVSTMDGHAFERKAIEEWYACRMPRTHAHVPARLLPAR